METFNIVNLTKKVRSIHKRRESSDSVSRCRGLRLDYSRLFCLAEYEGNWAVPVTLRAILDDGRLDADKVCTLARLIATRHARLQLGHDRALTELYGKLYRLVDEEALRWLRNDDLRRYLAATAG